MRVVSWNLGAAYGPFIERHEDAWRWLEAADPDIALLQEAIPPAWAGERWTIVRRSSTAWGSAVVARRSIGLRPVDLGRDSLLGRFRGWLATAAMGDLLIASVHARAKPAPDWLTADRDRMSMARPGEDDPWSNDVAFAGYRDLIGAGRFIVGGDWNTARYAALDGSITDRSGAFFDRAASTGWVELSLDERGQEGKSWYGGDPRRPYQPDHVFSDRATARVSRSATIDPVPAELGLSDHAPLVIELDLEAPG